MRCHVTAHGVDEKLIKRGFKIEDGVQCETCHGPVQSMERVRQFTDLSMGWCMTCHRENPAVLGGAPEDHASTDCAGCHY